MHQSVSMTSLPNTHTQLNQHMLLKSTKCEHIFWSMQTNKCVFGKRCVRGCKVFPQEKLNGVYYRGSVEGGGRLLIKS